MLKTRLALFNVILFLLFYLLFYGVIIKNVALRCYGSSTFKDKNLKAWI